MRERARRGEHLRGVSGVRRELSTPSNEQHTRIRHSSTAAKMAFAPLLCVAAAASPRSAAFYELAPGTMPTSISADGSVIAGAIGDASFVWRMNDKKTTILNHNALEPGASVVN